MNKKGTRALASATVVGLVLSTAISTGNVQAAPGKVTRLAGADRYATAAEVATGNWKDGAKNVILVAGEGYPDALSASLLSKELNAPILLTTGDTLSASTKDALKKLKPENVYVLGGTGVISQNVRNEVKKSYNIAKEFKGTSRFDTNIEIADFLAGRNSNYAKEVLVVNGKEGLADALSVAPVSAADGKILLIVGQDAATASKAEAFVKKHNSKVTIVGTENMVAKSVAEKLNAKRIDGGKDRFATNLKILDEFKGSLKGNALYIANGYSYVDSLVASTLAGKVGAPVVLVDNSLYSAKNVIDKVKPTTTTDLNVVGGSGVVSEDIEKIVNESVVSKEDLIKKANEALKDVQEKVTEANLAQAKAAVTKAEDAIKAAKEAKAEDKDFVGLDKLAASKKAIAEVEKAIEDAKKSLNVQSVSAINAKEIKVTFNREVNKDSAEDASKYTVYAGNKDTKLTHTTDYTAKLQSDKKTVIIQLSDAKKLINGQSYKLDAKDIIDAQYKKMVEYKGIYSLFQDTEAPKILKAEYAGSTVKLTFDEPLAAKPTIKIDNLNITDGDISLSGDAGKYEVTISNLSNEASSVGKHEVKIYGAKDLSDNEVDMITTTYTATENTAKPSIEKVEAYSQDTFKIKFNTSLNKLDASNFVIKKGNYTFNDITVTGVDNEEYTYKVVVKSSDDKNPLYAEKENTVSLDVKVKDFKGTNDIFGDAYSTTVKLSKDITAPVVQSDSLNTVEGTKKLVVILNEDLKSADKDKISVTQDGVIKTVANATIDGKDAKKLVIELDTELTKGTYNITLNKGAVKDLADNVNEAVTTKTAYEAKANTPLKLDENAVKVDPASGKNVITVNYGTKMTDSALNLANYKIDKVALNDASYKGTTIGFKDDGKKEVVISLAKGNVKQDGSQLIEISKNVLADNGQYVANADKTVYSKSIAGFKDDIAPTIKNIELVKGTSNATSTNTIKVTFSENIAVEGVKDATNDFIVKVGDAKLPVKAITIKGTDNKDRDYAVLTLGQNINVSGQTFTIKVTDNEADNKDGINIIDKSDLANKVGVTDTIKIEKVVTDASVVEESSKALQGQAEAEAVSAVNSAKAETIEKVITDNAAILGLDLAEYNNLGNKIPVQTALVGKNFINKGAVKTAFDDAVTTQKNAEADVVAANKAISEAKDLLVDKTLDSGDTNLLTVLNAINGMSAKGVTLEVKAEVTGATEVATAKIAKDGTITKGTTQQVLNVIITIAKNKGTTVEKTIKVTIPQV